MRINNNQSNISLSGHMSISHVKKIIKTSPIEVENYLQQEGINCHFRGNATVAALNLYAVKIFKSLNLPLPPQIYYGEYRKKTASCILAQTHLESMYATKEGDIVKVGGIIFPKRRVYSSPMRFDKLCDKNFKRDYGTTHFMNTVIHEYLHSVLCGKMLNSQITKGLLFDEVLGRMSQFSLYTFKDEIINKIGKYGRKDVMELHAVYWAKEICDSLGQDLLPRYNPIENPQTNLSPFLRKFITCVSNVDIDGANDAIVASKKLDGVVKRAINGFIHQSKVDKSKPL